MLSNVYKDVIINVLHVLMNLIYVIVVLILQETLTMIVNVNLLFLI